MSKRQQLTPNHFHNTRVVYFDQHGLVVSVQECRRNNQQSAESTTFQALERFVNFEISSKFFYKDGSSLPISILGEKLDSGEFSSDNFELIEDKDRLCFDYGDWKINFQIHVYQPHGNISANLIKDWLNQIPKEVFEYLKGLNERGANYNLMPAGFGWDGKHTHLDLFYVHRMRQLLIGTWRWDIDRKVIDHLSEQYMYSPKHNVADDWKKAVFLDGVEKIQVPEMGNQSELYVFFQNDKHSYHETKINKYLKSFNIPEGYDRCVMAVTNQSTNSSRQHGLAVTLIKKVG